MRGARLHGTGRGNELRGPPALHGRRVTRARRLHSLQAVVTGMVRAAASPGTRASMHHGCVFAHFRCEHAHAYACARTYTYTCTH